MRIWLVSFLFSVTFVISLPAAASPIIVDKNLDEVSLGDDLFYFQDETNGLKPNDAMAGIGSNLFIKAPKGGFIQNTYLAPYWFRSRINNVSNETLLGHLMIWDTKVRNIDIYTKLKDGQIIERTVKSTDPFVNKNLGNRHYTVDIEIPPGASEIFFKFQPLQSAIPAVYIFSPEQYLINEWRMGVFFSAFFSVLGVMFLYNLLIYFRVKDTTYLFYVLFLLSFAAISFTDNGFANQLYWPELPNWPDWLVTISLCFTVATGSLFTMSFLRTKERLPTIHKIFKTLIVADIIFASLSPFFMMYLVSPFPFVLWVAPYFFPTAASMVLFICLLVIISGVWAWRNGIREARFFLLGTFSTVIGSSISVLMGLGYFPFSGVMVHIDEVGIIIDMVLLSIALADKISALRDRHDAAQRKLTETLAKAKDELEEAVEKRTRELKIAKENAEAATAIKDKFVSLVSHDLRGPIGSIGTSIDFIVDTKTPAFKRDDIAEAAKHNIARLLELIDRLLDVGQLQSGRIILQKSYVQMCELLENSISIYQTAAEIKNISIVAECKDDDITRLLVDATLLGEAINNLISNAIKFCSDGDVITISSTIADDSTISIIVEDNGPGVNEVLAPNLFRPDIKTSTYGSSGERGTGLGLPYCHEIVSLHGGELIVESEVGKGACFTITLPQSRPVIMIVDDQPVARSMIIDYLKTVTNADMIEASDGGVAVDMLRHMRPIVLITDILMPNMDGFSLLSWIRSKDDLNDIAVIVCTSDNYEDMSKKKALELGADEFIEKPINPSTFIPMVKSYLAENGA